MTTKIMIVAQKVLTVVGEEKESIRARKNLNTHHLEEVEVIIIETTTGRGIEEDIEAVVLVGAKANLLYHKYI